MRSILMSSNDADVKHLIHSKRDYIGIRIYDKADEVMKKLLELLLFRYQNGLETSMRSSDFFFDFIDILYYKCLKVIPKQGGSYIDSSIGIKTKKQR